jgi:hypothetical protein
LGKGELYRLQFKPVESERVPIVQKEWPESGFSTFHGQVAAKCNVIAPGDCLVFIPHEMGVPLPERAG